MAAASGRMAAAPPDEIPGPPERSTAESPDRAARATGAARAAKRQGRRRRTGRGIKSPLRLSSAAVTAL